MALTVSFSLQEAFRAAFWFGVHLIKHLEKLHKLHLMTEVKLQTNLQNRQWNKSTLLDVSFEINSFVLLICL